MKKLCSSFSIIAMLIFSFNSFADGNKQKPEEKQPQQKEEVATPVVVVTTQATAVTTGCWATFFDDINFKGHQIRLYDGIDLPNMKFADGSNWTGRVSSSSTGPNARLVLYGEENWTDREHIVPPNTQVANFIKLPWNYIESVRMTCIP